MERLAAAHTPKQTFRGRTKQQFAAWKKRTLPRVLATLGHAPGKAPPRPKLTVEWEEDGLVKQRWLIDTQPGLSAALLLFRPADLKRGEKRPAILCCHGHGFHGKDAVMGALPTAEGAAHIRTHNYDYGLQMAQAGFVTYAIDWLGFGERSLRDVTNQPINLGGRDPCNILYLCATHLGTTVLALNCHDGSAATDFVCGRPFVDANRLGVMGLSFGGTMTTWMALTDRRFKGADIICYASPFHAMSYAKYNTCGSQMTPGLFELVDMADLQGLIAPRPLLFEAGIHDTCFDIDPVLNLHLPQLEKIYKAAGTPLELDVHPGEHAWGGRKSVAFFAKHLGLGR
jgi:dienelactone hydrolase